MRAYERCVVMVVVVVVVAISLLHAAPVLAPGLLTKEDASLCGKLDTPADCVAKVGQCAPLNALLTPLQGSPQTVMACINTTGVTTLKADFLAGIGSAMMLGTTKKSLSEKPTVDPFANLAFKQCILNATGMLRADSQLDRAAVARRVSLLSPPDLGAAVSAAALYTCPPPPVLTLTTTPFIKCLKKACVAAAAPAPTPSLALD